MHEAFNKIYSPFFQSELLRKMIEVGSYKTIKSGDTLIAYGHYVRSIPLVIRGSVKIFRMDGEGKKLLLYFLQPGESCAAALTCCLDRQKSEIKAVAETDSELLMLPIEKMEEWSSRYKSWRNFVFKTYHHQLMDTFQVIDSIAFSKLDERLLKYLKNKRTITKENDLHITHREIADDLNTSRVVISRLLKKLEHKKRITLKHNCVLVENL